MAFNRKEYSCMEEADELKVYFLRDDVEGSMTGSSQCFVNNNPKYISDRSNENYRKDLPWTPFNNCYGYPTEEEKDTLVLSPLTTPAFTDCQTESYQLFLKVNDPDPTSPEGNLDENGNANIWPIRHEALYLKAEL